MTENVANASSLQGAPTRRQGGKGLTIGIIVCAILAICGIVLWVVQLSGGMIQTAMRNLDSWGIYITLFMFFVGLSAGGLIISSVPKAFGIKGFGGISKVAIVTSIAATVCAMAFVVVDLGQPIRLWELVAFSNFISPLMWDIIVLSVYLILSIVYLWAQIRSEQGKVSDKAVRVLSVIALIVAVLVHTVTAWIFGLQQAREFWHTALLGPWFVASALVSGTALVLAVVIALRAFGYLKLDQAYIVKLAKLLGVFVCVDLYFYGCDLLTEAFPMASGADIAAMLTVGPLAPFFWVEIVASIVCVIVCFVPSLRSNSLLVIAGILAIVAIFCKRAQLLVGGFQIPNIDMPAVTTPFAITDWQAGFTGAYQGLVYWPSPIEFGVSLGVIALGVLIVLLCLKYLPLKPVEKD